MPSLNPTFGFLTLKGRNSRLVKQVHPDGTVDDWENVLVKLGLSGWKKGLRFTRHYSYFDGKHHYVVECRRKLRWIAEGSGDTDGRAWTDLYCALNEIGVMPDDVYQQYLARR